jgi:hypothetical protein
MVSLNWVELSKGRKDMTVKEMTVKERRGYVWGIRLHTNLIIYV